MAEEILESEIVPKRKKLSKRNKIIIIVSAILAFLLLLIFLIVPYSASIAIYKSVFNERYASSKIYLMILKNLKG